MADMNEQKIEATDLSMQMLSFIRTHKLDSNDWMFVNKLVRQLNKQNRNVSRKVLRSVQGKFKRVQDKYQR